MYKRLLNTLNDYSFFLFGARGTGKSTLLRTTLPKEYTKRADLLDPIMEDRLSREPGYLKDLVLACQTEGQKIFVIDEIQKTPELLNVVHSLIENERALFAMTGSSARKLKKESANLLAGRAFVYELFPLTFMELGPDFNLDFVLNWGSLPRVFSLPSDEHRSQFLESYALTYLKEEVWSEHLVQDLKSFRRFIEIAAQLNGKILNYEKISRDCHVDHGTVKRYFAILEDTYVGFFLEPFNRSLRKRQRSTPKFYFFDCGVVRALSRVLETKLTPQTSLYGDAFEHFILLEIFRLNRYLRKNYEMSYLQSGAGAEIDVILSKPFKPDILVEIKSSENVTDDDLKHLKGYRKDFPADAKAICLSREARARVVDGIQILPWQEGLHAIFG